MIWRNKQVKTIKWSDFFEIKRNEMVVYRVIPHKSVTNNQNRKLWRMLHKMYEIYDGKLMRTEFKRKKRLGIKVNYREKDTIWFDIVFRNLDGQKRVEFYTATTAEWAKKYRQLLESKMKVTVEDASIDDISVPYDDTIVTELRYVNHDIFSMKTDASEQTTPIGSVLSAIDDIDDGDMARLSVCNETYDRRLWAKIGGYAFEKLSNGKLPQRARLSHTRALNALQNGIITLFNELGAFINDIMTAISNVFFKSEKINEYKTEKIDTKKETLINDIGNGRISNQTRDKQYQPVWRSRIRVAVHSENKLRRELISNTIMSAYSEIGADNELTGIRVRFNGKRVRLLREINTLQLSKQSKADGDVNVISCDEMGKIALQMPTRALQDRYDDALSVNRKVETEIPSIFTDNNGMALGHAEVRGDEIPIYLPLNNPNETYRGYVMQGGMGMGKDTALQNFVVEGCLNHGMSFVIIDQVNKEGREGLANGIRDSLPPDKIIDLDYSDEDYVPPLDLTEVIRKLGRKGLNRFALEMIDFFGDVENMGQSRKLLREFAMASYGNIHDIQMLIEDENFRRQRIEQLRKNGRERLAEKLDKWTTETEVKIKTDKDGNEVSRDEKVTYDGQKALLSKAGALLNRLDEFLGDETLFNIFAQQPHNDVNFEKWMAEGKTIIIRVPDRVLGAPAVRTLVHWITLKVFMTRLLMSNDEQANGTFLVYNEPQTYLNDGLTKLISRVATQGRKERLGALIAVQYFDQLGKLTKDLTGGGVNWILFRSGDESVYQALKGRLEPNITIEDAMSIEKYHALNVLEFGGRPQPPFVVKMLPPSYERYQAYDNSFLTKRHARQYGRNYAEVDRMITEKERGVS